VRFREPIVSGSESVAGRLWTTDKSRTAAADDDDDDDGAGEDEKKKLNSYYDATTTTSREKNITFIYILLCKKKTKNKNLKWNVVGRIIQKPRGRELVARADDNNNNNMRAPNCLVAYIYIYIYILCARLLK